MKLAIVTITCRPEPRFADMAKSIIGSILSVPDKSKDHEIVWIVVDEQLAAGTPEGRRAREAGLAEVVGDVLPVLHCVPKPSKVRGPTRETPEDLPDQNNARNTGLAVALAAEADYALYLDDCTVITQSTIQAVLVAAANDHCLRVPIIFKNDVLVPESGKVAMGETGGLHFVPCKATTAAGGCFGMPIAALLAISGFDEVYAGAMGKQDLDAFVRAERAGWKWMTTKRCAAIQLGKTHDKASVSRNDEALSGRASVKPWNDLLRDKTRTTPIVGVDLDELAEIAADHLDEMFAGAEPEPAPPASSISDRLSLKHGGVIAGSAPTDNEPTKVGNG